MNKSFVAIIMFCVAFTSDATSFAKVPILFQGMDEVPLASICKDKIEPHHVNVFLGYRECSLNIDHYAGQRLIHMSKENWFNYSKVTYDPITNKVLSINFVMGWWAYKDVKGVLEVKYGKSQESTSDTEDVWFGDKYKKTYIHLSKNEEKRSILGGASGSPASISLVINTSAMDKANDILEKRRDLKDEEEKVKAVKGL